MSLKPVELQIALPRSTEAAKLHNDMQHRPSLHQQQLAGQNVKNSLEMAQRSTEVDESSEASIRDDGEQENHQGRQSSSGQKNKSEKYQDAKHPYKGHNIDFTM